MERLLKKAGKVIKHIKENTGVKKVDMKGKNSPIPVINKAVKAKNEAIKNLSDWGKGVVKKGTSGTNKTESVKKKNDSGKAYITNRATGSGNMVEDIKSVLKGKKARKK